MPYVIKGFSRELDEKYIAAIPVIIANSREDMVQKIADYFDVDKNRLEYSGQYVYIETIEDDFGFRVSNNKGGRPTVYRGELTYQGTTNWRNVERSITITGPENNR